MAQRILYRCAIDISYPLIRLSGYNGLRSKNLTQESAKPKKHCLSAKKRGEIITIIYVSILFSLYYTNA